MGESSNLHKVLGLGLGAEVFFWQQCGHMHIASPIALCPIPEKKVSFPQVFYIQPFFAQC